MTGARLAVTHPEPQHECQEEDETDRLPEPFTLKEVASATASTAATVAGAAGPLKSGGIRVQA